MDQTKKFPVFYGTRTLITLFTTIRHWIESTLHAHILHINCPF